MHADERQNDGHKNKKGEEKQRAVAKRLDDHPMTRTRNLLIRSQVRYPITPDGLISFPHGNFKKYNNILL